MTIDPLLALIHAPLGISTQGIIGIFIGQFIDLTIFSSPDDPQRRCGKTH